MKAKTTDYIGAYAGFLRTFLDVHRPLRVVFDSSNGTTGPVLQKLFKTYKLITYNLINSVPNGRFPAHGPDPFAPGAMDDLSRAVRRMRADLGAIFDADGDRAFFVDDMGRPVPTDAIAGLIGRNVRGPVILDLRSGYLAHELLRAAHKRIIVSRVGHYFIKKLMRKERVPFAAEFSGHYYFKNFFSCDSGIVTVINVMNAVSRMSSFGAWVDSLSRYYSSGEMNFKVEDKAGIMERIYRAYRSRARRVSRMDGLKMEFGPKRASHSEASAKEWWLLVRPSGTEDLLRVTVETKRKEIFTRAVRKLRALANGAAKS